MKLAVPRFAVRCHKQIELADMGRRVSQALGCELHRGDFREVPAMTGKLVGMTIGLYEWSDTTGSIFRFEGDVTDYAYLDYLDSTQMEIETFDISQIIRDALIVSSSFDWRISD